MTAQAAENARWRVRAIAFYLPQFHPIPENDEWWGKGFTEWTNVAKARPLFRGHEQPHLPGELGFYDLRVPETRAAQAALAQQYGLSAFCYWHYWFAGRRILERPFAEVLASGQPDFGFCLGWANQTWTGVWHGAEDRVLIQQTYPGPDDDRAHFAAVLPAFQDKRYFRVHGKPLFYIFRPEQLPDPVGFCRRWRTWAQEAGLPGVYFVGEISDLLGEGPACGLPEDYGFDAGVYMRIPALRTRGNILRMRLKRRFIHQPETYPYSPQPAIRPPRYQAPNVYPCVYSNWDNTPRSGRRGLVIRNACPALFKKHVGNAVEELLPKPHEERLLFVKSWNEWAEGNYLEPDARHGRAYLEAFADALTSDGEAKPKASGQLVCLT